MSDRAQLVLIFTCLVAALGFVGYEVFHASGARTYTPGATFTEQARLAEFSSNGVRVAVFMESDSHGQSLLRATFTPIDQGFQLYSKDLDLQMTGGVGLATRFELLPESSVTVAGQPFTDVAPYSHRVPELNTTVEIYPDGPVSLRLPIQLVGAATNITAQVSVSYMACQTNGKCLLPVERQVLNIQIQPSQSLPNASLKPPPAPLSPRHNSYVLVDRCPVRAAAALFAVVKPLRTCWVFQSSLRYWL